MRCVRIDYQLDTARSCTARITWIGDGAGDGTTETPCSDPTVIAPLVGKGEKRTYMFQSASWHRTWRSAVTDAQVKTDRFSPDVGLCAFKLHMIWKWG